jgi:hypothetical protein
MGEVVVLHTLCKLLTNSVDYQDEAVTRQESVIALYSKCFIIEEYAAADRSREVHIGRVCSGAC